jgi:hypothetical protein
MTHGLYVVDEATGELRAPGCNGCHDLAAKLASRDAELDVTQEELTKAHLQIKAFKRDRENERLQDPARDQIVAIFDYWRERCHHENARFDGKRFDLIKARLRSFTPDELRMAIDGAAVDAYVDPSGKRHDRLGLVFESAERVEDFCNRYVRWQRRAA